MAGIGLVDNRLSHEFSISRGKCVLVDAGMQGVYLSHERFISCFQGDRGKGQSDLPSCVAQILTLIQNNQYTIKILCGVPYPGLPNRIHPD